MSKPPERGSRDDREWAKLLTDANYQVCIICRSVMVKQDTYDIHWDDWECLNCREKVKVHLG